MNNITDILLEKINNENNYNNLSKYINILEENINLIDKYNKMDMFEEIIPILLSLNPLDAKNI